MLLRLSHDRAARATLVFALTGAAWLAAGCEARVPQRDARARDDESVIDETSPEPECVRCPGALEQICGALGGSERLPSHRADRLRDAIYASSIGALARRVPSRVSTPAWRAFAAAPNVGEGHGLRQLFEQTENAEVVRRIEPLRAAAVEEHARLRDLAIELVMADATTPDRDDAVHRLAASHLAWPSISAGIRREMHTGCGADLLIDDAWNEKHTSDIALCPGLLLGAAGVGAPDRARFEQAIAFMLAHELGHVIVGHAPEGRVTEALADRWGAEILGAEIERVPERDARAAYARHALQPLCDAEADDVHDSGRSRIRRVVASDREIGLALGCADEAERAYECVRS